MLNLPHIHFIIYLLCAIHIAWFSLSGGWLIYSHREQHDRSRLFIAVYFLFLAFGCINFILTGMLRGDLNGFINTILEPYPLLISFLPSICTLLYVLEIMQPKWLNGKRLLLILSPWLALSVWWLIYHGMHGYQYEAITHLNNVGEIVPNIHQKDVLLRVLLAAIYFPYACAILFIRYNWRTANVSAKRLKGLQVLILLCYIGFIAGMVLRIQGIIIAYFVVLDILSVYIIAIEKTARIPVPYTLHSTPYTLHSSPLTPHPDLSPLAQRLQQQLALQIWQDPDLDRDDVCKLLGTNRTYMAAAVQELGYANFSEMINRQRTMYMHDELLHNSEETLSDVIYRAGFRSRTTAINYFKQVYHCIPSDFAKE